METTTRDALAEAAVEPIRGGMIVGLGTGRAASRAIRALASRAKREGLGDLRCVATSKASATLAGQSGLTVIDGSGVERIDYLFDGADELTSDLKMLKGMGGAMTREKVCAHAADRRVYLVDASKIVARLGERHPLPVEVMRFAEGWVRARLHAMGLAPTLRKGADGSAYETDNGNVVLDVRVGAEVEAGALSALLDAMPGVVGHGLFLAEADEALIEEPGKPLQRWRRG